MPLLRRSATSATSFTYGFRMARSARPTAFPSFSKGPAEWASQMSRRPVAAPPSNFSARTAASHALRMTKPLAHAVAEHDELADADGMALDQPLEEVGQRLAVLRDVQAGVVPHIERSECEVLLEE